MDSPPPTHPVRDWRERAGCDRAGLADRLQRRGVRCLERTIEAIENGWRLPGADLSLAIQAETGITVEALRSYPLRAYAKKRSRAA